MNKSILILLTLAIFRCLYSDTITFSLDDFTFSEDSMIFKYKEKVYKKYTYSGYELPVLNNEVRFNGQYADSVKINSISTVLIKPDLNLTYFDGPMIFGPVLPRKILNVGARGVKRHGGFSVLEESPFFIRRDSLFFINSIDFSYYLNKSEIIGLKSQIYEKLDLVIITSDEFADNFEVYKKFKTKQGLNTIIKTVESIYAEYPGESNVIKIRNFIKDRYIQNDLEFVIIGGGYNAVPVGEALPYESSQTDYVQSDAFYSNLDGDPDENKNGIYFEFADNSDYYADVYVGRFPGNTESEIEAIINKNIRYYSSTRNYRTGFDTSAFLLGMDVNSSGDGRVLCNNIRTELPGYFSVDSIYENVSSDFNHQSIMNKFNAGYNFVYTQSHGDIHLIRQKDNHFKIWSDQIFNTDAVSGLYLIASCEPGNIGKDSFSRKAMISPDGGCVNYIGMSGDEWSNISSNMHAYLFNRLFKNITYGQSFSDAAIMYGDLKYNNTGRYLNFGYVFQGDPSNRPFLKEPVSTNISSIGQFKRGSGTVSGSFSTMPTDTIIVTLTADNKVISKTKATGLNFTLVYDNLSSDSVYVNYYSQEMFLTSYSYRTYSADEIEFSISSISVNGSNKSGIAEHGEQFRLTFKLNLLSNASRTDSLVAKITGTDHNEVFISDSSKRFKLPTVGGNLTFDAFSLSYISADSSASDSVAVADIEIQKKDGTVLFSQEFYIPLAVPYLKLQSLNRVGSVLKPTFLNNSKGVIDNARIELLEAEKSLYSGVGDPFKSKAFVELSNIAGYKVVSDSVIFSIDSTMVYKFAVKINNDNTYYSDEFLFNDPAVQAIVLFGDHSPGKINLEWDHQFSAGISYNIYISGTENFSSKQLVNFESINSKKLSFNYDSSIPVYAKVALVDPYGYEFITSDAVQIEPIQLYNNATFKLAPYQLSNPVFIDGKLISNSQNSSIAGLHQDGTPVNVSGLIHEAETNGFSGMLQQGFAVGDIDADGSNDMVNYSYNTGDSVLVKVVDLSSGDLIVQKKIYGFIMENAPVLVNADADEQLEILISVFNGNIGGTPAKGSYVYMLDLIGNSLNIVSGFPIFSSLSSYTIHSPSLLDLNGDGSKELIFDCSSKIVIYNANSLTKIIDFNVPKVIQTSLSFCDIDNDGNLEIFALTDSYGDYGKMFCYNFNGTTLIEKSGAAGGLNIDMKSPSFLDLTPPVSFADIDDDGITEIIALTASKLYVFNDDFTNYTNYPVTLDPRITNNNSSAASMGDLDGDSYLDILFMDANYRIWCYSGKNGEVLNGFPALIEGMDRLEMTALPIADLDSDGDLEFAVGVIDGVMIVYDYSYKSSGRPVLDKYRGDLFNSGVFDPLVPTAPVNILISNSGTDITINWNPVSGATLYKVYSSDNPYGNFSYLGETSGTDYVIYNYSGSKKFYYITALR